MPVAVRHSLHGSSLAATDMQLRLRRAGPAVQLNANVVSYLVGWLSRDSALVAGDPERVAEICCDMSPAFISGVEAAFPQATITFDKFHVLQLLAKAVDKTRKARGASIRSSKAGVTHCCAIQRR